MKRVMSAVIWVIGGFFVFRAMAEIFTIDFGDPGSYASDWGGPSLVGVLAVHMLPGVVAAVLMARALMRRREAD